MATKHSNQERTTSMAQKTKPATTFTAEVNKAALAKYAMEDGADFDDVDRGLIAGFGDRLVSDDGKLLSTVNCSRTSPTTPRPRTRSTRACGASRS